MNIERVEWHLHNWAAWMSRAENVLGYPSKASGFFKSSSASKDLEEMADYEDEKCATNMNAIIDGLDRRGKEIVNHRYLGANIINMYDDNELNCLLFHIALVAEKRNLF